MSADNGFLIHVCCVNTRENRLTFKVKSTTKMSRVMDAYASSCRVDVSKIILLVDVKRISGSDTLAMLDLEDGDVIEALEDETRSIGDGNRFLIHVRCNDAGERFTTFVIKRTTPMSKLMDAYASFRRLNVGEVLFQLDGKTI